MSLSFKIESELERAVRKKDREMKGFHARYTKDEIRDMVHKQFASWIVNKFINEQE